MPFVCLELLASFCPLGAGPAVARVKRYWVIATVAASSLMEDMASSCGRIGKESIKCTFISTLTLNVQDIARSSH